MAQKVVRKHRLLERFLSDILGINKEKVHDEACKLEHSLSDEITAALCKALNHPLTCPDDGKLIPPCTLNTVDCDRCKEIREKLETRLHTQLSQLKPGEKARVAFIRAGGKASQRIIDMGLCPGTEVRVVNAAPFNGPIEVSVRGTNLAIGRGLTEKVFVEIEECEVPIQHPHGPHHVLENRG